MNKSYLLIVFNTKALSEVLVVFVIPFCPKCGKEVDAEARFCSFCGVTISSLPSQPTSVNSVQQSISTPSNSVPPSIPTTKPHMKTIIIGYIFALLGGLFGVVIGFDLKNEQDPYDKKHGRRILVLSVVMIVVWVGVYAAGSMLNKPQPVILEEKGVVYPLQGGYYQYGDFIIYQNVRISGAFTATNGATFYIMTPSQFASFSSSGIPSSYVYTTGRVSQGSINTILTKSLSEQYYLVFINDNLLQSSSVLITQSIIISAP